MTAPACSRYDDALRRINELLATEQTAGSLRRYLSSFGEHSSTGSSTTRPLMSSPWPTSGLSGN